MIELCPQCLNIFTPISFHLDSTPSFHISLHTHRPGARLRNNICPPHPHPFFTPQLHELGKLYDSQLLPSLILPLSHWPLIFVCPVSSVLNWLFYLLFHPLLIHPPHSFPGEKEAWLPHLFLLKACRVITNSSERRSSIIAFRALGDRLLTPSR